MPAFRIVLDSGNVLDQEDTPPPPSISSSHSGPRAAQPPAHLRGTSLSSKSAGSFFLAYPSDKPTEDVGGSQFTEYKLRTFGPKRKSPYPASARRSQGIARFPLQRQFKSNQSLQYTLRRKTERIWMRSEVAYQ
jgi:hypothetical protein